MKFFLLYLQEFFLKIEPSPCKFSINLNLSLFLFCLNLDFIKSVGTTGFEPATPRPPV